VISNGYGSSEQTPTSLHGNLTSNGGSSWQTPSTYDQAHLPEPATQKNSGQKINKKSSKKRKDTQRDAADVNDTP
jgi:hypothetical protein